VISRGRAPLGRAYNAHVPRSALTCALAIALLAPFVPTRAADAAEPSFCRAIDGGSSALAAIDAERRLAWLNARLKSGADRALIWTWIWRAGYTGVVVVEASLAAAAHDTPERAADIVGATSSAIGVLAGIILPLKIMGDQKWWARHYARYRNTDDICSLLNTAELLFIRDAESEAFGVGPLVHVGNFAINIAGGLILGLGYNRWSAFAYTSLVGIVVGEVQVATQPTDVVEDLRLYRRGELDPHPAKPRLGVALAPMLVPNGGGASVLLRW
jgi:hypothetical protein